MARVKSGDGGRAPASGNPVLLRVGEGQRVEITRGAFDRIW